MATREINETLEQLAQLQEKMWAAAKRYETESQQFHDGLLRIGIPERMLYKLPLQRSGPGRDTASMLLTAMLSPEMRARLGYAPEVQIGEQQRWDLLRMIGNEEEFDETGANCVRKMDAYLRPLLGGEAGHKAMLAECARFLYACLELEDSSYDEGAPYVEFKLRGLWQARTYGDSLLTRCRRTVDALWVTQHPGERQRPPEAEVRLPGLEPGARHLLLGGALKIQCFKTGIRMRLTQQLAGSVRTFLSQHMNIDEASDARGI